jgi:hypothetical protein
MISTPAGEAAIDIQNLPIQALEQKQSSSGLASASSVAVFSPRPTANSPTQTQVSTAVLPSSTDAREGAQRFYGNVPNSPWQGTASLNQLEEAVTSLFTLVTRLQQDMLLIQKCHGPSDGKSATIQALLDRTHVQVKQHEDLIVSQHTKLEELDSNLRGLLDNALIGMDSLDQKLRDQAFLINDVIIKMQEITRSDYFQKAPRVDDTSDVHVLSQKSLASSDARVYTSEEYLVDSENCSPVEVQIFQPPIMERGAHLRTSFATADSSPGTSSPMPLSNLAVQAELNKFHTFASASAVQQDLVRLPQLH